MNTDSVTFFKSNQIKPLIGNAQLILAVWEIGNPGNIGQIIRIAHNVGAKKIVFINEKRDFRISKIKKTAGFSFGQMNWEFISKDDFFQLIKTDYQLVVLETFSGAENIFNSRMPQKSIILAGSESHGVPLEIIGKSKLKVFIPAAGGCKSLNVSHALAVASFEWYRQNSKS